MANENLWAPWRIGYVKSLQPGEQTQPTPKCFICEARDGQSPADPDLILQRDKRGVLMLNRYPYTNGHLLAAPPPHVCGLGELSEPQRAGMIELTHLGVQLLELGLGAQGANVGMNLGQCAGAGLPGHLHMHLVPRWHGDVNFMEVTGGTRVIPEALGETARKLRQTLESAAIE